MYAYVYALFYKSGYFTTVKTKCTHLSVPANGRIVSCSSGTTGMGFVGDTCSFTCDTGYELTGSDIRTCQNNRSWSGSDVICRRGNLDCLDTDALLIDTLI